MWAAGTPLQIGKPCPPDGQAWNPRTLIQVCWHCPATPSSSWATCLPVRPPAFRTVHAVWLWVPACTPACTPCTGTTLQLSAATLCPSILPLFKQACAPNQPCGAACSCPAAAPHCVSGRGQSVGQCSATPLLGAPTPQKRTQRFPANLIPSKPSLILANYCKQPVWPALVCVLHRMFDLPRHWLSSGRPVCRQLC